MKAGKLANRTESNGSALTALYGQIGGMPACRRLSESFHDRIAGDPVLRPMFPKDLEATTGHFGLFLAQTLGGPPDYAAKRGKNSLVCRHAHVPIGADHAERWLAHMSAAMEEEGIPKSARQLLDDYFRETAATLSDPFLPYYHLLLGELSELLLARPELANASDHGRTLLRAAAGDWDVNRVALLLEYGADVSVKDLLGHDALYRACNAQVPGREADGRAVVNLLIQHGADANGRSGPGRLTPLHAVARRGTVEVVEALLASGADIEARDSKGETPLRRAVNCNQEHMVRLLLAGGADPLLSDKRGTTVLAAARTERIGRILREAIGR